MPTDGNTFLVKTKDFFENLLALKISESERLVLVNDPGFALQDESLFNGRAMTYYGRWIYKLEEAARLKQARSVRKPVVRPKPVALTEE